MICADLLKAVSMALGFHQLSLILQCGIPGNPGGASIARRDDMRLDHSVDRPISKPGADRSAKP
jgi:hypothetical protein